MMRFAGGLLLLAALSVAVPSEHDRSSGKAQQVLSTPGIDQASKARRLRGRFLHITDIHPDPFYNVGTNTEGEHPCHAGKGDVNAGYYGAPATQCDTPFTLINATFKWIEENLKDEIDFVVWTGDSARHDNDLDIPRSSLQVQTLNQFVVSKFVEVFGKTDNIGDSDPTNDFVVPIVPTFGNNDILPHNILEPGPNKWTKRYIEIWKKFIPEEQYHTFERGGWFFTEVIPNKLVVFSLNTLYFFDNNSAVDGCDRKSEPGYEHMEWLRVQLQFIRARGMKAILSGHIPPARTEGKKSWDETCYQKYTLWLHQYRDVIVGGLYGHMNIDHFMFQDVRDLTYDFRIPGIDDEEGLRPREHISEPPHAQFNAAAKITYLNELRTTWANLPTPPKGISYTMSEDEETDLLVQKQNKGQKEKEKFLKDIGGRWGERFSMALVSPSIVPNYFPTLRVIDYNITGLEHAHPATGAPQGTPVELMYDSSPNPDQHEDIDIDSNSESVQDLDIEPNDPSATKHKKHKKKKHHNKKPSFPLPKPPSRISPPGPAYSPQTFTFLRWTQFYANLTKIHETMDTTPSANVDESQSKKQNPFTYKIEYTTHNDSAYRLPDLTVRSWLDIAERIGRTEYKPRLGTFPDNLSSSEDEEAVEAKVNEEDIEAMKHKKQKHKKGKLSANHLWHAFVKRAYVHTKPDKELEQDFG